MAAWGVSAACGGMEPVWRGLSRAVAFLKRAAEATNRGVHEYLSPPLRCGDWSRERSRENISVIGALCAGVGVFWAAECFLSFRAGDSCWLLVGGWCWCSRVVWRIAGKYPCWRWHRVSWSHNSNVEGELLVGALRPIGNFWLTLH